MAYSGIYITVLFKKVYRFLFHDVDYVWSQTPRGCLKSHLLHNLDISMLQVFWSINFSARAHWLSPFLSYTRSVWQALSLPQVWPTSSQLPNSKLLLPEDWPSRRREAPCDRLSSCSQRWELPFFPLSWLRTLSNSPLIPATPKELNKQLH